MTENIMNLKDLSDTVSTLKKDMKDLTSNIKDITLALKDSKNKPISNSSNSSNSDMDLNGDGTVSKIEVMVVKTLQSVAEKTQRNNIYTLGLVLGFLLLSAILAHFGIFLFS